MFFFRKSGARRAEIRKNRPDVGASLAERVRSRGGMWSLGVAVAFCVLAVSILILRDNVIPYRPGQFVHHDITSRVLFKSMDDRKLDAARERAREKTARRYKLADPSPWTVIQDAMLALPNRVGTSKLDALPPDLKPILDPGSLSAIQEYAVGAERTKYISYVNQYISLLKSKGFVILPDEQTPADPNRMIVLGAGETAVPVGSTLSLKECPERLGPRIDEMVKASFSGTVLQPKMKALTLSLLTPTHIPDDAATAQARALAAELVPVSEGEVVHEANSRIVQAGEIRQEDWLVLRKENEQYVANLGNLIWARRAGLAGLVALMTAVICFYVSRYQPRIVKNHARAAAIAVLLLSMLLLAQLAAIGSSSLYFSGVAPTILVAMILTIAYDPRFALGMATFHAVLVTLGLGVDLSFLTILESGLVTCCFLLDDLRTRSKLIEVGGATALAMIAATAMAGFLQFDPLPYVSRNCLYAGAAGLAVGFVVLGILPFIEKSFRITTSMTLLELADASQPLLRRLSLEAPGTYNHSLQVATLAEEAAEAIGANSLLCRVAAYYHDIGKINKAEYFIENQTDGHNRHINLSPNVSLLIIIGHVKDGVELAKEYNLPTSIFPFILQHHGTTLVEFFYHRACDTCGPDEPDVQETQFRYPGPKPRTREIAILMLADAVESACRAMSEPTASRIETLVHEITLRRLHDGQFVDSDLTMRDLDLIERSLVKSLLGIYHGRIAYPSTAATTSGTSAPAANSNIKTA